MDLMFHMNMTWQQRNVIFTLFTSTTCFLHLIFGSMWLILFNKRSYSNAGDKQCEMFHILVHVLAWCECVNVLPGHLCKNFPNFDANHCAMHICWVWRPCVPFWLARSCNLSISVALGNILFWGSVIWTSYSFFLSLYSCPNKCCILTNQHGTVINYIVLYNPGNNTTQFLSCVLG